VSSKLRASIGNLKWALLTVALLAATGCGHFWEDVTSRSPEGGFRNDMAFRWHLLFHHDDPLVVLRDSRDGDLRARAYRELQEPKQHGGTEKDQEAVLKILATGATKERSPVCRVAAIETLGTFKDPRAADALNEAFYAPVNFGDKNPVVRMATLRALANTGDTKVARTLAEAMLRDPAIDVRIAAAKGLAKYPTSDSTTALLKVLQSEKRDEVALRFEANQSLQEITGKKDMPPRAEDWEQYFRQVAANPPPPKEPKSLLRPASWFKDSE
jgi:HEAT repeat protein/PBS lyase HEAT-like repeat-containing protein